MNDRGSLKMAINASNPQLPQKFPTFNQHLSRKSSGSSALLVVPPSPCPFEPAYIAPSVAAQIILTDYETRSDNSRPKLHHDTTILDSSSLSLINHFLDQLLFNFVLRSPSLVMSAIRPAIAELFNPTMASLAFHAADLELEEYIGKFGNDLVSDMSTNAVDSTAKLNQELVWQHLRLRCMAYSSLGDFEEEDEFNSGYELSAESQIAISPIVAIFLTSVLEYIGEYILLVAGQYAYHRFQEDQIKSNIAQISPNETYLENLVVEAKDVERIAYDKSLGQLWMSRKDFLESPSTAANTKKSSLSRTMYRSLTLGSSEKTKHSLLGKFKGQVQENLETELKKKKSLKDSEWKDEDEKTWFEYEKGEKKNYNDHQQRLYSLSYRLAYLDLALSHITCHMVDNRTFKTNTLHRKNSKFDELIHSSSMVSSVPQVRTYVIPATRTKNKRSSEDLHQFDFLPIATELAISKFPKPPQLQSQIDQIRSQDRNEGIETSDASLLFSKDCPESNKFISTSNSDERNTNVGDKKSKNSSTIDESSSTFIPRIWSSGEEISPSYQISNIVDSVEIAKKSDPIDVAHSTTECDDNLLDYDSRKFKKANQSDSAPNHVHPESNTPRTRLHLFPKTESISHQSAHYRPNSISTPSSLDMNRPHHTPNSRFRWGPLSQRIKARSDDFGKPWALKFEKHRSSLQNVGSTAFDMKYDPIPVNQAKRVSSDVAQFAAAMQGVDIYSLDMNCAPRNPNQDQDSFPCVKRMKVSRTNMSPSETQERAPDNVSDGNVSPLSSVDDSIPNGRVSPVSTVSSISQTPDVRSPLGIYIPSPSALASTLEDSDEYMAINHHKVVGGKPTSASNSSQTKSSNHTSESSSFAYKFKVVRKNEDNALGKFDQLIRSDQTIQFTLTPQNVSGVRVSISAF